MGRYYEISQTNMEFAKKISRSNLPLIMEKEIGFVYKFQL